MLHLRTMNLRPAILLGGLLIVSSLTACVEENVSVPEDEVTSASLRGEEGQRGGEVEAEPTDQRPADERPEREDSCQDDCEARGAALFRSCVDAGGAEDDCAKRARRYTASCVTNYCEGGDDEGGSCEDRCYGAAEDHYNLCVREGGDDEACARRARHWAGECIADNCEEEMEEPTRCELRCQDRVQESFQQCVRNGGDVGRCRLIAHRQLEECLANYCEDDGDPPVDRCEAACTSRAQQSYAVCVRRGGDTGRCAQIARAQLSECLAEYCEDEEPPADRCDDICSAVGMRALNACVDSGRDEALCARYARSEAAQCQERCENAMSDGDDVCEDRCNARAEELYGECVRAGGDEDACAERARHNASSCVEAYCGDDDGERGGDDGERGGDDGERGGDDSERGGERGGR